MKPLSEILTLSIEYVRQKGSTHTRREVEELIAYSLGKKRLDLFLNFDKPLNNDELACIRKNLTRLAANEPLQYIEGKVRFYDCTLHVDKRVLIPRPETELLVDRIVKHVQLHPYASKVLWDVCTGSGCIGIALKKALGDLSVTLSDISRDALDLAATNAELNEVDVHILQGDLLDAFKGQKADFIVCNPPYIAEGEYATLAAHVRDFEPKGALVSGQSGFECYERLFCKLSSFCNPGALCWLEIGYKQGQKLLDLLSHFKSAKVIQDFSQNDRFIEIQVS